MNRITPIIAMVRDLNPLITCAVVFVLLVILTYLFLWFRVGGRHENI